MVQNMETLAQKARGGEKEAENQLFQILLERFRFLAKRRVGEEDCEDLAQEACATVFEKYKSEEFNIGFTAWAHGVLRNKIGNFYQRKGRDKERLREIDETFDPPQRTLDPDLKCFLLACLMELIKAGGHYARVLNLSHQGYKADEICGRLNISINSCYVVLSRSRTMLKTCLGRKGASI